MTVRQSTSEILKQLSPEIMKHWEARAIKEVSATVGQSSLILQDSLPNLIDAMASLLETHQPSPEKLAINAADLLRFSKNHGKGRAEIPLYLMSQVITEYQILRQCIFESLERKIALSPKERELIITTFEQAVNVAATEFAATLKAVYDAFTLSIAHDLKTPIASIQAGVQLLHRTPEAAFTLPLTERLSKQTKQMTDMVNLLLDTSQTQAGKPLQFALSEFDLAPIAQDLIEDMKFTYGDHFVLVSKDPIIGFWNPDYLRRMIENLVNNALKFGLPESPITIQLRQAGEKTTIEVHNWGDPIPEQVQEQLFTGTRRLRIAAEQKGWGLGLPLVKAIADAFQGTIRVVSTAENGTRMIVELPNRAKDLPPLPQAA